MGNVQKRRVASGSTMRRKLIASLGELSQVQVSSLSGVSTTRLNKIITGKGTPYALELFRIARAIGVSLDYLLDDEQEEPAPGLAPDESKVIWLMRTLGVDAAEAARSIATCSRPVDGAGLPSFPSIGLPGRIRHF